MPGKRKSKIRINVNVSFFGMNVNGFFFGGGGRVLGMERGNVFWFSLSSPEDVTREPRFMVRL